MRHLERMLTAAVATIGLALPVLANDGGRDQGRGERYSRGGHDSQGYRPTPRVGFGVAVGGGPVYTPAPAYPAYSTPVDNSYNDPQAYSSYETDPNYNTYGSYAPYAPPPPRREFYGRAPAPGYVWVNGYWRWAGARYVWYPGSWMRPPHVRAAWVPGGWVRGPRGFGFRVGFWRR